MSKKISIIIAASLLVFQFALQIHLAKVDSQTTDEAIHLYAGYRYLVHQDFSYNPEHPPLVKYAAAFPLLFMDINEPEESYEHYFDKSHNFFFWGDPEQSTVAEDFLYNSGNDAHKILFWGRVPMVVITLLLGILVFTCALYAWGWKGGLLAVALYVLDPNITAHGHLITTDMGFAFGALLSIFSLWLFMERRSWKRAIGFGGAVGIALLTKFSALLLVPVFLVLALWKIFADRSVFAFEAIKDLVVKFIAAGLVAWAILIAGYGFNFKPAPYEDSVVQAASISNHVKDPWVPDTIFINNSYNFLRHFIVPKDYLRGLLSFAHHATAGHPAYLFKNISDTGWWYYFPVVFTAKTFLFTLFLFAYAIYLVIKNRKEYPIGMFFLIGFVAYFALSMTSKVNIGLRHVMPALPLMAIIVGIAAAEGPKKISRIQKHFLIPIFFIVLEFAFVYPYYLSYFNQAYGGTMGGYKVATDSNYDWGQDLHLIKDYIEKNNIEDAYIDYNWGGASSLLYSGIPFTQLAHFDKEKGSGTIIVGATVLTQRHYEWLRAYPIHDRISPSVFVFKIKHE